jgi:23S rRNA (guanosine2251-2'-O)-methyltransferase
MSAPLHTLFGFHAVQIRLKTAPQTVQELHLDPARRDARMRQLRDRVRDLGADIRLIDSDETRLRKLCGSDRHQGVVARVHSVPRSHSLDDTLDAHAATVAQPPLLLVLDGITDPHNLGACLRVADAAGVAAVVAPQDHSAGLGATVSKVACGGAETVPYLLVKNLARALLELKERGIRIVGTTDRATASLYDTDLSGPVALVLGAEDKGLRQLTAQTCDELVRLPMMGVVESLNVSVASGICLYEAVRQRQAGQPPHNPSLDEEQPAPGLVNEEP